MRAAVEPTALMGSGLHGAGRDAKGFWTDTVVLISKDENLTKSHARYVEACLIRGVVSNPRWTLPNTRTPSDDAGKLPLPDRAAMEEFVDQTKRWLEPWAGISSEKSAVVRRSRSQGENCQRLNSMKALGSSSEARASRQRWRLGPPGISSSQQVRGQGSGRREQYREGRSRSGTPLSRRVSSARKAIFLSSQAPTASRLPLLQLRRSLVRAPMAGSSGSSRTDAITPTGKPLKACQTAPPSEAAKAVASWISVPSR